jgi:hypothetical protein
MAHSDDTLDVEHLFFLQLQAAGSKLHPPPVSPVPPGPLAMYMASHPAAGPDEPPAEGDASEASENGTGDVDDAPGDEWALTLELPRSPLTLPWIWTDLDD